MASHAEWRQRNYGLAAFAVGLCLLAGCDGHQTLREKLARWVNVGDCAIENQDFPARGVQVEYPKGFLERARIRAVIACTTGGPSTYYFRFASRTALRQAIAAYPGVRRHQLCVVGNEVFDGDSLTGGTPSATRRIAPFCRQLHGVLIH